MHCHVPIVTSHLQTITLINASSINTQENIAKAEFQVEQLILLLEPVIRQLTVFLQFLKRELKRYALREALIDSNPANSDYSEFEGI